MVYIYIYIQQVCMFVFVFVWCLVTKRCWLSLLLLFPSDVTFQLIDSIKKAKNQPNSQSQFKFSCSKHIYILKYICQSWSIDQLMQTFIHQPPPTYWCRAWLIILTKKFSFFPFLSLYILLYNGQFILINLQFNLIIFFQILTPTVSRLKTCAITKTSVTFIDRSIDPFLSLSLSIVLSFSLYLYPISVTLLQYSFSAIGKSQSVHYKSESLQ